MPKLVLATIERVRVWVLAVPQPRVAVQLWSDEVVVQLLVSSEIASRFGCLRRQIGIASDSRSLGSRGRIEGTLVLQPTTVPGLMLVFLVIK